MTSYLFIFLGSAYMSLALTPLVIWLARRIKAVDHPGIRSVHCEPIPRIGGVAIYLSSMALMVPLFFLNNAIGELMRGMRVEVLTLLVTASCVFAIGLVDDLRGMPARFKFLVELLGAIALCSTGVIINSIDLGFSAPIQLGGFGCILTILWIVGVTNAVNMSDGLDGLAAGIVAIACAVIAIFAIHGSLTHTGIVQQNDVILALFTLALLGSLTGFLFFNSNPAKVFMGDSGSLFIGFVIASTSVMCVSKSRALVGLALPLLVLGLPIFDTLFAMLRRFLERRSLFAPDKSHLHHLLLERGFSQRKAVIIVYGATLLVAGLGVLMLVSDSIVSLLLFATALLVLLVVFRVVGNIRLRPVLARLQDKYKLNSETRQDQKTFENLQLQFRQAHDSLQWRNAICEAAQRMDFAWVALRSTQKDGSTEEEVWRSQEGTPNLKRIVTMTLPVPGGEAEVRQELEIAITVNGSLETAGRRGTLFSRLVEEYDASRPAAHTATQND